MAAGDRDQAWAEVQQAGVGSELVRQARTLPELWLKAVIGLTGAGCMGAVRRRTTAGFYYLGSFGQTVPGGEQVQTVGFELEIFFRAALTEELEKLE